LAQISLKYLSFYFLHNIDIALYTIAFWQYKGVEMSLIDRQWRWFITLGVIALALRIINFTMKYTSQQVEIQKQQEELKKIQLENKKRELELENMKSQLPHELNSKSDSAS
jgi:hypothetical protein